MTAAPRKPGYLLTLSWYPESDVGGVNQAVLNLARVMSEYGEWDPFLLMTCHTTIPADHPHLVCPSEAMYLRAPDVPPTPPLRSLFAFLGNLPRALKRLKHLLESRNIRIVNCHFPNNEVLHFAILRRLNLYRGKLVLSFHGEDIRVLGKKTGIGLWAARWMMRQADAVVACSKGLMQDLVNFEPACAARASVIYNAIDVETFHRTIDRSFDLPSSLHGRSFLLNVARYEHKKGHDILLKAFEKLSGKFPDLKLVTMGTSIGEESDRVRKLFEASPLRDKILMLENVPHSRIGVFLEAASLFALPSRREGFPFVLLEAGAMPAAVVACACIGVPEIIEDGVTGRLVPVEDWSAFADAAEDLLLNQPKRAELAARLHDLVVKEFCWETSYRKHVAFAEAECD